MTAEILKGLIAVNLAAAGPIIVMLIAARPIRRLFGARIAYAAWAVVPLAAAASLLPARRIEALPAAPLRPLAEATVIFLSTPAKAAPVDWSMIAVLAWAVGALALIAFTVWTQSRTLGLIGRLTPEGRLIRAANPAVGPAILGVFRPRIMVPADFERRFDRDEQAVIMAHEEAHLASGDVRVNALIELCRCLLWFNPLIHLAARAMRIDQELACDAAVIARFPKKRRTYAQALLKTQTAAAPLPLGCYWPERSGAHLKERLTMLTLKSPGRVRRLCGGAAVAMLGLATGYAAWAAAPEPVAVLAPMAAITAPTPATAPEPAAQAVKVAAASRPSPAPQDPATDVASPPQAGGREQKPGLYLTGDYAAANPLTGESLMGGRRVEIRRLTLTGADIPAELSELAQDGITVAYRCEKHAGDDVPTCASSDGSVPSEIVTRALSRMPASGEGQLLILQRKPMADAAP